MAPNDYAELEDKEKVGAPLWVTAAFVITFLTILTAVTHGVFALLDVEEGDTREGAQDTQSSVGMVRLVVMPSQDCEALLVCNDIYGDGVLLPVLQARAALAHDEITHFYVEHSEMARDLRCDITTQPRDIQVFMRFLK